MKLKITTLIENNSDNKGQLLYEHGLSLYIEADGLNILFDTGQSGDFIQNAEKLQKDLTSLNYIIISHGHYDHSGGFARLVDTMERVPKLMVGAEFFDSKYKKTGENKYKYNGNFFDEEFILQKQIPIKKLRKTSII